MTIAKTKVRHDKCIPRHITRSDDLNLNEVVNALILARIRERVCDNCVPTGIDKGEIEYDCDVSNPNWDDGCTQGRYFSCDEYIQTVLSTEELKEQIFYNTARDTFLDRIAAKTGLVRREWEPDYLLRIRVFNSYHTHYIRGSRPGMQEELGMIFRVLPVLERDKDGAWVWVTGFAYVGIDDWVAGCKDCSGWFWRFPLCDNYRYELHEDFETTDLSEYDEYNDGAPGTWQLVTDVTEVVDGVGPAANVSMLYADESRVYDEDNIIISFKIKKPATAGHGGLAFFIQDGADADGDWYYLGFSGPSNVGLLWRTGAAFVNKLAWTAHGLTITNWNDVELHIDVNTNDVEIFFNGASFTTVAGCTEASSGQLGFSASNSGHIRVDDIYAAFCSEKNSNFVANCTVGGYEACDEWLNRLETENERMIAETLPIDHLCGPKYVTEYASQMDYSGGAVTVDTTWSGATTYGLNDIVYYAVNQKIYRSLQAGNLNKIPASEPEWWVEVLPLDFTSVPGHIIVDEGIPGIYGTRITFTSAGIDLGASYASWVWFIDWIVHRKEFELPAPWEDKRAKFFIEYSQSNVAITGPWGAWQDGVMNENVGSANRYIRYRFTIVVYAKDADHEKYDWIFSRFNAKALTTDQAKYL